jgi:D-alanine-D-alanine ligase
MSMKTILLLTGPAGDAQGWGDIGVTRSMCRAIKDSGHDSHIAFVSTMEEFYTAMEAGEFDMVWSALYHISGKSHIIGRGTGHWLADYFDSHAIPYVGPDSLTMKHLINKTATHDILADQGIAVPFHVEVPPGQALPDIAFPAFVKPSCESRSVGISDDSVVHTRKELARQVAYIHNNFDQPALVEEYLPGDEYTVLMLGNGRLQKFLPGRVEVDPALLGRYPILRSDLRGVGVTRITRAGKPADRATALCKRVVEALNCLDHVRVDMRMDAQGDLKVIEANGIPGLKPVKSWSPQLFSLYHSTGQGPNHDYQDLIHCIVSSALERYGLA